MGDDQPDAALLCAGRGLIELGESGFGNRAFDVVAIDDLRVFPIQNSGMALHKAGNLGHGAAVPAIAPSMAAMISGAGFLIPIRKSTMSTLSSPEREGGSKLRAHAG